MIGWQLCRPADRPLRVLCLGAHCDDIEIGCGGTVLALGERHPDVRFVWIVCSASPERRREAEASVAALLPAQDVELGFGEQRDGYFPWQGDRIKDLLERLKGRLDPDVIFTHYRDDRHQDHRVVSDLTWNTFRDHLILEYEVPKYDGDLGTPNVFMPLLASQAARKVQHLMEHFTSQRARDWFREDTFSALMRLRGLECNAPERAAEAFYCRKLLMESGG